jgi:hypothetical protein
MTFQITTSSPAVQSAVDILESVGPTEQRRLLRVLRLERARSLAKKLDKRGHPSKLTYKQIDEAVNKVRKTYGRK